MVIAAAAPKVAPKVARQIVKAVGSSKANAAIRQSKNATKQNAIRQQQRVGAAKSIKSNQVRSAGSIQRQRVKGNAAIQQQRVAAAQQISIDKSQIRHEERAIQIADTKRTRRNARVTGIATAPFKPTSTVSAPSVISPILLIIFAWAGIIIMYALITSPNTSSNFFNSMREWVGLLYQTKPMFTTSTTEQN